MKERLHADRLGELVGGKYRIVRFLAEGGMGVVYEAQHAVVRRRFAVKFLHPDLAVRREILTRFEREAEAAGALESENVAAAVDFGIVADGTPYIVMEYLVGESLGALLEREGRLPIARAADLIAQACRGIQAAHAAGIVHRDLKPQNLFVCRREDGTDLLKVLDFGVAKLQAVDDKSTATRTGAVVGTVSYMSPEQARGDKVVDLKADVYALGAILYEVLSGRRPHPGESHNAILYHISTQPPVPLEAIEPGLPASLGGIVARALASEPHERHPSAEALGAALAPLGRREVWPAVDTNRSDSGQLLRGPARPASAPVSERSRSTAARRRPRALIALGATVVVAAAAIALRTTHRTSSPASGSAPPAVSTREASTRVAPARAEPSTEADATATGHPRAAVSGSAREASATRPIKRSPSHSAEAAPGRPIRARDSGERPTRPLSAPSDPDAQKQVTFDQQNPYD